MTISLENARSNLVRELRAQGLVVTSTAFEPLTGIDFSALVGIYDHEEHFLRTVFYSSLVEAHRVRLEESGGTEQINEVDVRAAMLMLGEAVSAASEAQFSSKNKAIVTDICPYCG